MIYYIDNKETLDSHSDIFSSSIVGKFYEVIKPFNYTTLYNISFFVDIQDFYKLSDDFFTKFLGNNNIIFSREHKIDVTDFANGLIAKIKQFNLDSKKIYIVVAHGQQKTELERHFLQYHIENINIYSNMFWLTWPRIKLETDNFQYQNYKIDKKFSIFSRRYVDWRRNLYLDLLIKNILPECHYTFSNLHPDIDDPKSIDQMLENLPAYMEVHKPKIIEWFQNELHSLDYADPFNSKITYLMQESAINIVLETHIIEQSNGVTLTEKTYKPILINRPFIVYGIPYILDMLRKEGFKTFNGIIDESYDTIVDENDRRIAIVNEINRINLLPKADFDTLLEKCENICAYNFELAHSKNRELPENFTNRYIFGSK